MRAKKTIVRGFGEGPEGETVEEESPDFRHQCAKLAGEFLCGDFCCYAGKLYDLVAHYMVRMDGKMVAGADIRETLEALHERRIKPEQLEDVDPLTEGLLLEDVDPLTEGLLMRAAYLAEHKVLAQISLYDWTDDELSEVAEGALKLFKIKRGRPADDVTQTFYDNLLELWLAAGKPFPPNPSASSELRHTPDFHRFALATIRLTGKGGAQTIHWHYIACTIKKRQADKPQSQ